MITEKDYRLPNKQEEQPQPKADPATLSYLDALGWRPLGVEW